MEDKDLPRLPSLDEVLRSLDKKYHHVEGENNFVKESHSEPVAVNYPFTLICSIKSEHSDTRNGEIQVIQGESVICSHLKSSKNFDSEVLYCGLLTNPFSRIYLDKQHD